MVEQTPMNKNGGANSHSNGNDSGVHYGGRGNGRNRNGGGRGNGDHGGNHGGKHEPKNTKNKPIEGLVKNGALKGVIITSSRNRTMDLKKLIDLLPTYCAEQKMPGVGVIIQDGQDWDEKDYQVQEVTMDEKQKWGKNIECKVADELVTTRNDDGFW